MNLYEFIRALRSGKTADKDWKKLIDAVHRLKLANKILEEMHCGLSKFPDGETKKFVSSLP